MEKNEKLEVRKAVMLVLAAIFITGMTIILTRSEVLQKPVKPIIPAQTALNAVSGWLEVSTIKQDNNQFTAVAVDCLDKIYAGVKSSESFHLAIFSADGKLLEIIPAANQISGIATAADGTIYVAAENQISVIPAGGPKTQIKKWPCPDNKTILTSLAADDKHVFAADAGNRQVYVYARDGKLINTVKGTDGFIVPSPYFDVVADGSSGFWVANPGRHQLENYTAEGRFIAMWQGDKPDTFLGCCNPAHFQLMSKGRIVTCEKGLVRIRIFGPDGKLESEVCGAEAFKPGSTCGQKIAVDSKDRVIVLDPAEKSLRIFAHANNKGNAP